MSLQWPIVRKPKPQVFYGPSRYANRTGIKKTNYEQSYIKRGLSLSLVILEPQRSDRYVNERKKDIPFLIFDFGAHVRCHIFYMKDMDGADLGSRSFWLKMTICLYTSTHASATKTNSIM